MFQYDFCFAVKFIYFHKFYRQESKEILSQEISFNELIRICIEMNELIENDLNHFFGDIEKTFCKLRRNVRDCGKDVKVKVSYFSIDRLS